MPCFRGAIVGVGKQARADHIPGIKDSRRARLVAVCDSDEEILDALSHELGVPAYPSFEILLEKHEVDFIILATPHDAHHSIIAQAAQNGVHILKEKPFARTIDEALSIRTLSLAHNVYIMTTLQRRFNPIYSSFFQFIDRIGNPFFVEARYTTFVADPNSGWRGSQKIAGGGCIIDMGYHMVDVILWYFGLPNRVHAEFSTRAIPDRQYDAEDTASIVFRYESGLHGCFTLSRYYPPKTESVKVIGSRGMIDIQKGLIRRLSSSGEELECLRRTHSWRIAATDQIDYFCRIIAGEEANTGDPDYHLQHMCFVTACYESKVKEKYIDPSALLSAVKADLV